MITLADRVRSRRRELKMSQDELARKCGQSRPWIGKIERNETRQPREIHALADALGTTPAWLLFGSDEAPAKPARTTRHTHTLGDVVDMLNALNEDQLDAVARVINAMVRH